MSGYVSGCSSIVALALAIVSLSVSVCVSVCSALVCPQTGGGGASGPFIGEEWRGRGVLYSTCVQVSPNTHHVYRVFTMSTKHKNNTWMREYYQYHVSSV